jgi:PAS domain S-box-containing protein
MSALPFHKDVELLRAGFVDNGVRNSQTAMSDTATAQALRESEELHRITLMNMSDAVFITDDRGVFTYVCPNVHVIFGHSQDDVYAMGSIVELLGREIVPAGAMVGKSELRNIEHDIETRSGDTRSLLIHVKSVAIRGGTVLYVCRDVTERRRAERALRGNEQRLTLALEAANMGTWDWHVATGEMAWSPETHRMFGDLTSAQRPSFDAFIERVHPADRGRVSRVMNEAMNSASGYDTEFRVVGYDRIERWVYGRGRALRNGIPLRMIGVFVDFTERQRVEQHLRELGGRVIQAHDHERHRLARELHEEVGRPLTELAAAIDDVRAKSASVRAGAETLVRLSELARAAGSGITRVSHELYPEQLEEGGLSEAVRALCQEYSNEHRIDVRADVGPVPRSIEPDRALCVFRVAQEALRNMARHSRATRAILTLVANQREVLLSVVDGGVGFDSEATRLYGALGIVSMSERARLVQGQLIVTSKPGRGTRVELRVPLHPL